MMLMTMIIRILIMFITVLQPVGGGRFRKRPTPSRARSFRRPSASAGDNPGRPLGHRPFVSARNTCLGNHVIIQC